jgi:hypothetical protein
LCLGPDGALYAATLPSGKVYKLNPSATEKQDESSATVVFDAAKVGFGCRRRGQTGFAATEHPIPLHLGTDLRRCRTALYRNRQSWRDLPRRSRKPARRPELFFKSDEAHIRALAWDAKGI